jgi:hypothetical protein
LLLQPLDNNDTGQQCHQKLVIQTELHPHTVKDLQAGREEGLLLGVLSIKNNQVQRLLLH